MPFARKFLKGLASLKFAVLIMASLGVLISAGTVVEAQYDAWTAKNLIYNSVWMYATMGMLVVSLAAVMVDRWPWKVRHIPFIFAHIGIIGIIYGSFLTQLYGVDGTINLSKTGGAVKEVTLRDEEINVFRSFDGSDYERIYSEPVNFIKNPIAADKPTLLKLKDLDFEILESIPYSIPQLKVEESNQSQSGAGLRFQLSNQNVSEVDWLVQRNVFEKVEKQIGPVLVTLGGLWDRTLDVHEIRLSLNEKGELKYAFYRQGARKPEKQGVCKEGDVIETGWMGLQFRALRFLPKAVQKYEIKKLDRPSAATAPSLRVRYNGQESYLFLNDYIKVFTQDRVYLVAYQNQRIPLGFSMNLVEFQKTDYPGTMRAMAYQSAIEYADGKKAVISMNEPLKFAQYYFYQASFEESKTGAAIASILSVNKDPGRIWKYLGSLIMCLGIVALFVSKSPAFRQLKQRK